MFVTDLGTTNTNNRISLSAGFINNPIDRYYALNLGAAKQETAFAMHILVPETWITALLVDRSISDPQMLRYELNTRMQIPGSGFCPSWISSVVANRTTLVARRSFRDDLLLMVGRELRIQFVDPIEGVVHKYESNRLSLATRTIMSCVYSAQVNTGSNAIQNLDKDQASNLNMLLLYNPSNE